MKPFEFEVVLENVTVAILRYEFVGGLLILKEEENDVERSSCPKKIDYCCKRHKKGLENWSR